MAISQDVDLQDSLREAGLTEYQARAYLSLLPVQEARILALSRASGVPRNKLYGVLEDLERMGLVERVSDDPLAYAARPIRPYVEARIKRLHALLEKL